MKVVKPCLALRLKGLEGVHVLWWSLHLENIPVRAANEQHSRISVPAHCADLVGRGNVSQGLELQGTLLALCQASPVVRLSVSRFLLWFGGRGALSIGGQDGGKLRGEEEKRLVLGPGNTIRAVRGDAGRGHCVLVRFAHPERFEAIEAPEKHSDDSVRESYDDNSARGINRLGCAGKHGCRLRKGDLEEGLGRVLSVVVHPNGPVLSRRHHVVRDRRGNQPNDVAAVAAHHGFGGGDGEIYGAFLVSGLLRPPRRNLDDRAVVVLDDVPVFALLYYGLDGHCLSLPARALRETLLGW